LYIDRETYGFTEKTPQSENQQAQTAQEAASAPSQEAHLAEVIAGPLDPLPRQRRRWSAAARGLLYRMNRRLLFPVAAFGLGVWLLAGCRTVPGRGSEGASPLAGANLTSQPGRAAEREMERRARAQAHYAAAIIHELNDEREKALEEFALAARANPDDEALTLEVTRRLLPNKKSDKALELLQAASVRPEASGLIFARLGLVYAQLGQIDKAIEANRMAIRKAPLELAGYQNLFLNHLQANRPEAALKVLDEAARQTDADGDFMIGLAELYASHALQFPSQREALHAKGLKLLGRVKDFKLRTPHQRLKLADGFNLFGDSERAAEGYLDVLKMAADLPMLRHGVRLKLADIYLRTNDRQRASEQLEAIVRDDPANAQAYYQLGRLAYEEERWAEAIEHWRRVLVFNPDFQQAHYDLAAAQIALGSTSDALATLDRARAKFSSNFVIEYLQATAHIQEKNYAEAVNRFTAAELIAQTSDTNRLNHGFYFQVGAALERKGDRVEAAKYFEKSLALAPEFDEALNYLGYMWAEHGENLEQARDLIARALKAEPDNAAYLDSMGWVLFKLNQPKEALGYLLKSAAASEEPDATIYDHLGDVYDVLQQPDKAREAWRKSLEVEANEQVRKKLDPAKTD
jgi:tetratricopeptide (TPR) repeat protein